MSRVALIVDRDRLVRAISAVEAAGPLSNMSALWVAAAAKYNDGHTGQCISPSVVYLRATEWKLEFVTKAGRRGRSGPMTPEHKAAMLGARGAKVSRRDKLSKNPLTPIVVSNMKRYAPSRLHVLVDQVGHGSMKAAIKLMCCGCMGYEDMSASIRDCTSHGCPLYLLRPFQKATDTEETLVKTDEPVAA
jgi:hypothetical protein